MVSRQILTIYWLNELKIPKYQRCMKEKNSQRHKVHFTYFQRLFGKGSGMLTSARMAGGGG